MQLRWQLQWTLACAQSSSTNRSSRPPLPPKTAVLSMAAEVQSLPPLGRVTPAAWIGKHMMCTLGARCTVGRVHVESAPSEDSTWLLLILLLLFLTANRSGGDRASCLGRERWSAWRVYLDDVPTGYHHRFTPHHTFQRRWRHYSRRNSAVYSCGGSRTDGAFNGYVFAYAVAYGGRLVDELPWFCRPSAVGGESTELLKSVESNQMRIYFSDLHRSPEQIIAKECISFTLLGNNRRRYLMVQHSGSPTAISTTAAAISAS